MSGFDWIIAAIFLISVVIGVLRGFIREALSIVSWVVALWLAVTYCQPAGEFIATYVNIPADAFRTSAGFALVFVATLFLFSLISFILGKLLVKGAIKGTDRLLGLIFGAVRAAAIVIAVMLLTRGMGLEQSEWLKKSSLLPHFESAANFIQPLLPEQLQPSQIEEKETGLESSTNKESLTYKESSTEQESSIDEIKGGSKAVIERSSAEQ